MKHVLHITITLSFLFLFGACTEPAANAGSTADAGATPAAGAGQSAVQDDVSRQNVLQIAMGSKGHTTLVAAVKAAGLVDVLVNAGPFTVFAPTDEAFAKLPKETLDNLMKPENKAALSDILEYHVYVGVIKADQMRDGQKLNQVNLKNVVVGKQGDKITLNGSANIIASVPASNGIVHVIDAVLLPPDK